MGSTSHSSLSPIPFPISQQGLQVHPSDSRLSVCVIHSTSQYRGGASSWIRSIPHRSTLPAIIPLPQHTYYEVCVTHIRGGGILHSDSSSLRDSFFLIVCVCVNARRVCVYICIVSTSPRVRVCVSTLSMRERVDV